MDTYANKRVEWHEGGLAAFALFTSARIAQADDRLPRHNFPVKPSWCRLVSEFLKADLEPARQDALAGPGGHYYRRERWLPLPPVIAGDDDVCASPLPGSTSDLHQRPKPMGGPTDMCGFQQVAQWAARQADVVAERDYQVDAKPNGSWATLDGVPFGTRKASIKESSYGDTEGNAQLEDSRDGSDTACEDEVTAERKPPLPTPDEDEADDWPASTPPSSIFPITPRSAVPFVSPPKAPIDIDDPGDAPATATPPVSSPARATRIPRPTSLRHALPSPRPRLVHLPSSPRSPTQIALAFETRPPTPTPFSKATKEATRIPVGSVSDRVAAIERRLLTTDDDAPLAVPCGPLAQPTSRMPRWKAYAERVKSMYAMSRKQGSG